MRNEYNLSHEHKLSADMGYLIPVLCDEVLPGDTFVHSSSALVRVAPLASPLMHRVELRLHHWYVPNRILWDGWEDFITGKDETTPKPTVTLADPNLLLADHMGIAPRVGLEVDALPFRAYNLIWSEMYRDQDLQTERDPDDMTLARIAWQKDYLTVARPSPQQGDPVAIPISGDGRIKSLTPTMTAGTDLSLRLNTDQTEFYEAHDTTGGGVDPMVVNLETGGINIDDFRRSMALQRFAEARMRYGSRYVDYLRYIGVNPSDGRLDRPEYLGGGKETLAFSEVLATAETTDANVGDLYGHGIGMGSTQRYRKMFEEHGWVLTLMSARPKTVYQDMVPRKFQRKSVMDYWQKELEVLPWQQINQLEVHRDGDPTVTFGYVPRYEEYRHGMSHVSGTFRGGTENDWHMAREFASPPQLNGSFIECTPTDRIYQDSNMPELLVNVMHNIRAARYVSSTHDVGTFI